MTKEVKIEFKLSGLKDRIKDGELRMKVIYGEEIANMPFEQFIEVLDKSYVEYTMALKHNWNEDIRAKE